MKAQITSYTTPATKKASKSERAIEQIDEIECIDFLLAIFSDTNQVNSLFNLILKVSQSPEARRDALSHIRNSYMCDKTVIH